MAAARRATGPGVCSGRAAPLIGGRSAERIGVTAGRLTTALVVGGLLGARARGLLGPGGAGVAGVAAGSGRAAARSASKDVQRALEGAGNAGGGQAGGRR